MKYPMKYSLLILCIVFISACKTQEIYKVNKNGDISVDVTVVIEPIHNKKTEKLGTLIVLESSLDEVIGEFSKAHWNVESKWLSKRAPYKLQLKLDGNINNVKDTTKYYKFTSIGGNVVKFDLNGNNGDNLFNISMVDRTYTFKSTLFSGVEYYDVNGNKLKKSTEYNRMDAVYAFLENDNRTLSEIKNKAIIRNKAKVLANKTITKYIDGYFPTCNGSRYMISPDDYPERTLSEIKDAGVFTVGQYLNKADVLNGTIWKGTISLIGDVSRELLDLEKGWSEWKEKKVSYVRLDVQIKDKGDDKVIYEVKDDYWSGKKHKQKLSLQRVDCIGVDNVAGTPALNNVGVKYLNNKDYKKSLTWFIKAAKEGSLLADYYIGYLYEHGLGQKKSIDKALFWYKKSADKGNAIAQNHLGNIYSQGLGVNRSNDQAYGWYKKSAEKGNALAQGRLGFLYLNGLGVQKSDKTAFFWYKKSAEQGNTLAQSWLAKSYKNGIGVAKDEKQALMWSSRAEDQGYKDSGGKYSKVNSVLTITNKKLTASSVKATANNKALIKTNIKLSKHNKKITNENTKLVQANKKLMAGNKRLLWLNKQLKNKLHAKRAVSLKKTANVQNAIKRSASAKKTANVPVETKQPAVVNKENTQSAKIKSDVTNIVPKVGNAVHKDKASTQVVNNATSSADDKSATNAEDLKGSSSSVAENKEVETVNQ